MAGVRRLVVKIKENYHAVWRPIFPLAFHWGGMINICASFHLKGKERKGKLVHYHYNTSASGEDNDFKTHTRLSLLLPLLLYE